MNIRITPENGEPLDLGDDGRGDYIDEDLPGQSRSVQAEPMFRSKYQKLFPRGNRMNRRSFVVEKQHDDLDEAFRYRETHADNVPDSGKLELTSSSGSVRLYYDAVITDVACIYHNGVTTKFRYSILYTAPTTSTT